MIQAGLRLVRSVLNEAGIGSVDLRERILYHQINPLKLITDWCTGLAATWLMWDHDLILALVVGIVPPCSGFRASHRLGGTGQVQGYPLWGVYRTVYDAGS